MHCTGYFLTQSIIMYTAGIKLFMYIRYVQGAAFPAAAIATLVTCIPLTAIIGEIFYRLFDWPSRVVAKWFFDWIRE